MNYYVGIRESLIDRARGASNAALGEDSGALLVRAAQNSRNDKITVLSETSQGIVFTKVTETQEYIA